MTPVPVRSRPSRPPRRRRAGRRAWSPAALAVAAVLAGTGCTTSASNQGTQEVDQGYVAGDGSLVQLAPDDREQPVEVAGQTL